MTTWDDEKLCQYLASLNFPEAGLPEYRWQRGQANWCRLDPKHPRMWSRVVFFDGKGWGVTATIYSVSRPRLFSDTVSKPVPYHLMYQCSCGAADTYPLIREQAGVHAFSCKTQESR